MSDDFMLRVRTQIGLWRVKDVDTSQSVREFLQRLGSEHSAELVDRPFSRDGKHEEPLDKDTCISELGLNNGDMVYLDVDAENTSVQKVSHTGAMKINKDGNLVQTAGGSSDKNGFRPGMMPLRNMKMQWRLDEFLSLDEQFNFNFTKMKDQKAFCEQVVLDHDSFHNLAQYMFHFDYQKTRVAFLYGTFTDANKAQVEAIYEPPQDCTDKEFNLLEDEKEEKVAAMAAALGLKRVGWLVIHPPREEGFIMSGLEALTAAELQLEAAEGVNDTPFVTILATLKKVKEETEEGKPERLTEKPIPEAYQTHKLCMEMVAEGALDLHPNPGFCAVNETFTAIAEGRELKDIPTQMMIATVPIARHKSETFISKFPVANREGVAQTKADLKKQLSLDGSQGWTTKKLLRDFHLLVFLCDLLTMDDIPVLCQSLLDPEVPLQGGHLQLIRRYAGFDM